eukprot:CAMPEP_0198363888 /NCGR_PEP_ID=MMETSP1450-20131203/151345_1 /TAXON_ID=753684 ORGANISM="Madagascaria erythrocladiodes, Strain CCMP3234" /NCGR_SAMPLE_ID=MMETSP1450 /ASSEMBLY_ACC=CAM_ASM_001115 /LENGTH=68 /DNA_ID=CAMNT_0044071257 /DNA_START=273 /DNA_END=477 /DNA_ORIENTATION=+
MSSRTNAPMGTPALPQRRLDFVGLKQQRYGALIAKPESLERKQLQQVMNAELHVRRTGELAGEDSEEG